MATMAVALKMRHLRLDVAMLVYKDEAAALDLYNDDSPEAFLILGAALPALAGPQPGPAFKVFILA